MSAVFPVCEIAVKVVCGSYAFVLSLISTPADLLRKFDGFGGRCGHKLQIRWLYVAQLPRTSIALTYVSEDTFNFN